MSNQPLITSRTDWNPELLHEVFKHIEDIAATDLKITQDDIYPNQIEIISAEQMIDAYASVAMPVMYSHWSFGKTFLQNWKKYQKGQMGLAYEVVINSNPCISYLMEENNAVTQTLVMAHAAIGHNFVFKNNYMFKEWTNPSSIIDYMIFAKNYIRECEEKYGEDEVERVLDAAHAIASHGVDKSRRKHKKKLSEEEKMKEEMKKDEEKQKHLDIILQTTSIKEDKSGNEDELDLDKVDDEENLIYFIYKNAPNLEQWKREILRIVYKIRQYFYPQMQDKVLNEGMATFTHFYIMNALEEKGIISADAELAWLALHSSVLFQPTDFLRPEPNFNPYALGFDILKEVRRICSEPTKEDEEWFPNLVGKDWRDQIKLAVSEYRDESFIEQFLSPALIRKYRLMTVDVHGEEGTVTEISDELGYQKIRHSIASTYNPINYTPDIVVYQARMRGDRTLTLLYRPYRNRSLYEKYARKTIDHIKYLWGYNVEIVTAEFDEPNIHNVLMST